MADINLSDLKNSRDQIRDTYIEKPCFRIIFRLDGQLFSIIFKFIMIKDMRFHLKISQ